MSPLRPTTHLETHDVVNQPPPFEDVNLFTADRVMPRLFRQSP
jgi:putative acyl-CoA dehydrogenase